MAHVLQGMEAQALLVIVRAHPDEILLLEHDGFVARRALVPDELERRVRDLTGISLQLEGGQIVPPAIQLGLNSRAA